VWRAVELPMISPCTISPTKLAHQMLTHLPHRIAPRLPYSTLPKSTNPYPFIRRCASEHIRFTDTQFASSTIRPDCLPPLTGRCSRAAWYVATSSNLSIWSPFRNALWPHRYTSTAVSDVPTYGSCRLPAPVFICFVFISVAGPPIQDFDVHVVIDQRFSELPPVERSTDLREKREPIDVTLRVPFKAKLQVKATFEDMIIPIFLSRNW